MTQVTLGVYRECWRSSSQLLVAIHMLTVLSCCVSLSLTRGARHGSSYAKSWEHCRAKLSSIPRGYRAMQEWLGVRPACLCFSETIIDTKVSRVRRRRSSHCFMFDRRDGSAGQSHNLAPCPSRARSGDVVRLRLTDVDWTDGTIRVCGKGRRHDLLPLPQEVGTAVLRYLQKSRPASRAPECSLPSCPHSGG